MSLQVRVRSRGGAQGVRPSYFRTKLWPEGRKKIFLDRPIPLSQGMDDRLPPPPPLTESLDPQMQVHY